METVGDWKAENFGLRQLLRFEARSQRCIVLPGHDLSVAFSFEDLHERRIWATASQDVIREISAEQS